MLLYITDEVNSEQIHYYLVINQRATGVRVMVIQGRLSRRRTAPSTTETGTGSWTGHST